MLNKKFVAFVAALVIPFSVLVSAQSASAAGVNDINNVVRYGNDGRVIGSVVTSIADDDDSSELLQAPWPMNFFGRKYDGLCVTTNGTISPVDYATASCDDSYDENMADLADSYGSPVIAAFANDNDLGNTVLDWESVVSTFSADVNNVVTVTTSSAHGLTTNDVRSIYVVSPDFDNANSNDLRTDDYWFGDVTVTVVDATTFTFDGSSPDASDGSSLSTPSFPAGTINVLRGWVWDQSSGDINGADDGVGLVNTVYVGTTTIDGRDAWVYTDYRSVTYEDDNPQILTNTFQIVLIKRDTLDGANNGFNFDIEYNYGAVMDGGDGYDADNMSCDAMSDGCRTGVGLVDWDPIGQSADVYELFGSTPSRDLVDWYDSGMTSNRLNTTLNGRYTFSMVYGQVQEFAIPVMDGTGTTSVRPVVASPTDPVPAESGKAIGDSSLLENGSPVSVQIDPNGNSTGLVVTDGTFTMNLAGLDGSNDPLDLDANGHLILKEEGLVSTSGTGFAASSPVKVYMYSNPTYLGMLFTDSTGAYSGTLSIPAGLELGIHNIQVIGYDANNNVKVLTIAVTLTADGLVTLAETGAVDISPYGAVAAVIFMLGLAFIRNSRVGYSQH